VRLDELITETDIVVQGQAALNEIEIRGLTADSRKVEPGWLFAALPGTRADGRAFIADALTRGAAALLVPAEGDVPQLPRPVPMIRDANPRRRLALLAAQFYGRQPRVVAAVTGTNGKTSTADFTRQIWMRLGRRAASLGTLGVVTPDQEIPGALTTPDPIELHRQLAELAAGGIDHLAMEASSHGLDQFRLDGVRVTAAAFTNLGRDHLDYHATMAEYLAAKQRLFESLLIDGGTAVLNADAPEFVSLVALCHHRGLRVIGYGRRASEIRLERAVPTPAGQRLTIGLFGKRHELDFPLAGEFQAMNALAALGLVIGGGDDGEAALATLGQLTGVRGRLERVAVRPNGAAIYVDYAHKPGALETVLATLRPHTSGKLAVVFGCGGDRDRGKRPQMGEIAERLADRVIVTDDNPRSEDPAAIRAEILAACRNAAEIGDRAAAIRSAIAGLAAGDVLVIAGKGHETYQIVGDRTLPFDDAAVAREALTTLAPPATASPAAPLPLWSADEAAQATGGRSTRDWSAVGVSIDSRSVKPKELFVALKGPNFDGHDYVGAALRAGAAAALVHRVPEGLPADAPLLVVDDTMAGLEALGQAARRRSQATFLAVTGSVGKTGTKEMLRLALGASGPTYASTGNLNNQWGVPLSLANMGRDCAYAVFELGMNHAGEIGPLSRQVRPKVAIITTVEPAHLEFFPSVEAIADAKAEIFEGMEAESVAILNRDNPHFERLAERATMQGIGRIVSFGRNAEAQARLVDSTLSAASSRISADILGDAVDYRLQMPGAHWALNSLAVLAAAKCVGVDLGAAAAALAQLQPLKGRGQRVKISLAAGSIELIDESYNASPAAMRAAFQVLAQTRPASGGRRIAVLGDMRELGETSRLLHADLAPDLKAARADLVFTCGPLMEWLHVSLSDAMRGGHAADSQALLPAVVNAVHAGDVVLVKGSLGSRMAPIVEALRALEGSGQALPRAANGN
jgi:UDP-N-acetylmuramyl-tripeptide synthetase/UDP-N-acetylmuramoyl-tripeptide--D-alanyl-D-alanine ligase